eukprot:scaffold31452_cov112-Isochrysis_galbana.AAC.3
MQVNVTAPRARPQAGPAGSRRENTKTHAARQLLLRTADKEAHEKLQERRGGDTSTKRPIEKK